MGWYRTLTSSQRRILLGMAVALVTVLGLLGWSVWTTLHQYPSFPLDLPGIGNSALDTPTLVASVLDTPTLTTTPTPTEAPTATSTPTATPTPTPTPAFEVVEAGKISDAIGDARGVVARWGIPLALVNEAELASVLYQYYRLHPPLVLEERVIFEMLGMWPEDGGVQPDTLSQAQHVAALYVPEESQIYLRQDWTAGLEPIRLQLAYGYARALPDQYGDIPNLVEDAESLDRRLALIATAQGDAMMSLWRYMGVAPGSDSAKASLEMVSETVFPTWRVADAGLDSVSRLTLYIGAQFASARYAQGRLAALDDVIRRPPRSTEQILHPERYMAGDEPVILSPAMPKLPSGWELVEMETLGEALMGRVLLSWSAGLTGTQVVEEWGGDLLQIWSPPEGEKVALWHTTWDTSTAARRFFEPVADLLPGRIGGHFLDVSLPEGLTRGLWWSNSSGGAYLRLSANHVWLVWGDDPDAVAVVAVDLFGIKEEMR